MMTSWYHGGLHESRYGRMLNGNAQKGKSRGLSRIVDPVCLNSVLKMNLCGKRDRHGISVSIVEEFCFTRRRSYGSIPTFEVSLSQ